MKAHLVPTSKDELQELRCVRVLLGEDRRLHVGLAELGESCITIESGERLEARSPDEWVGCAVPALQDADGATSNLAVHGEAIVVCLLAEPEHVLPEIWMSVVDVEVEDDRMLGDAGDLTEPTE